MPGRGVGLSSSRIDDRAGLTLSPRVGRWLSGAWVRMRHSQHGVDDAVG